MEINEELIQAITRAVMKEIDKNGQSGGGSLTGKT